LTINFNCDKNYEYISKDGKLRRRLNYAYLKQNGFTASQALKIRDWRLSKQEKIIKTIAV